MLFASMTFVVILCPCRWWCFIFCTRLSLWTCIPFLTLWKHFVCSRIPLVLVSVICYLLTFTGIILMYVWFTPRVTCRLNIFFITWTLILVIVMTGISLQSKVRTALRLYPDINLNKNVWWTYVRYYSYATWGSHALERIPRNSHQ